ncbi:MAG: hypothetical protein GYA17_19950 [Chloroflexi bacterium]|jgi:dipeptidyl aminopeptidase/acylaminoacyl peptidase|nr:hypothetical protein [Chloroflexota bacterium]
MASRSIRFLVVMLGSGLVLLACSFTGRTSSPLDDQIGTSVAGTVTAALAAGGTAMATPVVERTAAPTPGPATDSSAAPRIVFTDGDRNLWADAGAEPSVQLVDSMDVDTFRLSPDGRQVVYLRSADFSEYSLWVVQTDGSGRRELISSAQLDGMTSAPEALGALPYQMEWIDAGNTLAFNTSLRFDGPGLVLQDDLWLLDIAGGAVEPLLAPGSGGQFYYSPDGAQIALVRPDSISLIDAGGGNRRDSVLTYEPVLTYSEYAFYAEPAWAPDSSYLRVVIPPPAQLDEPTPPSDLWQIPADGSAATRLTRLTPAPLVLPVLSPDGSRLAYLKRMGEVAENRYELRILEIDADVDSVYVSGGVSLGAWSPDSMGLAIYDNGASNLLVGQVGSAPLTVSDSQFPRGIRWLDAENFVFFTLSDAGWDLRQGSSAGGSRVLEGIPNGSAEYYLPQVDVRS